MTNRLLLFMLCLSPALLAQKPLAQKPPQFEVARTLTGHKRFVTALAFSPDSQHLATGSWDGTVKLWLVASGRELRMLTGHSMGVTSVAFSPDGKLIAAGSDDATVIVWDAASGHAIHTFEGDPSYVTAVAFSPDGALLAAATNHARIKIFDIARGECAHTLEGHSMVVHAIAFTPDGRTLISGSRDQTIKFWDVASGKILRNIDSGGERFLVSSLAVSPDGRRAGCRQQRRSHKALRHYDRRVREKRGPGQRPAVCFPHRVFPRWEMGRLRQRTRRHYVVGCRRRKAGRSVTEAIDSSGSDRSQPRRTLAGQRRRRR